MNAPLPITRTLPGVTRDDELRRLRQVRALLGLFALYAGALVLVMLLSDGADIGCILAGIAGHVLYASARTAAAWREASWLEAARARLLCRRLVA
ncbi:MAG: hypothetical protein KIS78_26455 [Labilithrix sp.]|nr:hypothetical protein [Labilithrix sp.]MCW5835970.1 hypothetical protein [Labilithrix sp.]